MRREKILRSISIILLITTIFTATGCGDVTTPAVAKTSEVFDFSELMRRANALLPKGQYEEAVLLYASAVAIEPRSAEAQTGLGKAYRGAGKPKEAVSALQTAQDISPDDIAIALELTQAYTDNREYGRAGSMLTRQMADRFSLAGSDVSFHPLFLHAEGPIRRPSPVAADFRAGQGNQENERSKSSKDFIKSASRLVLKLAITILTLCLTSTKPPCVRLY